VNVVYNTIIDCKVSFQMPSRENGLGATNITFAYNLISGGSPVSIKGQYSDGKWAGNTIWNTSGGDIPATGYKSSQIPYNQPYIAKMTPGHLCLGYLKQTDLFPYPM
jgi:poly(beta-D-mannuronate) lyase